MPNLFEDFSGYSDGTELISSGDWVIRGSTGGITITASDVAGYGRVGVLQHAGATDNAFVCPVELPSKKNWQFRGSFLVPSGQPVNGPGSVSQVKACVRAPTKIDDGYNIQVRDSATLLYAKSTNLAIVSEIEWVVDQWFGFTITAINDQIYFNIQGSSFSYTNTLQSGSGYAGIRNIQGYTYWRDLAFYWDELIGDQDEENPETTEFNGMGEGEYIFTVSRGGGSACADKSGRIWVFNDMAAGDYNVTVERDGCADQVIPITIE